MTEKTGIEDLRRTEEFLNELAKTLDEVLEESLGKRLGFAMIIFEFGAPGIANYISNAERDDMIEALKGTVERFEKGETIPPVFTVDQ